MTAHNGTQRLLPGPDGWTYTVRRFYRMTGAPPWWRRHYARGRTEWLDAHQFTTGFEKHAKPAS